MLSGREKRRDPCIKYIYILNSFMIFRLRHNYQLREWYYCRECRCEAEILITLELITHKSKNKSPIANQINQKWEDMLTITMKNSKKY